MAENTSSNALHHKSQKKERLTVLKNFKAIPRENTRTTLRAMIDDRSQSTWILARTAKALKLPVIRRALLVVSTAFSDDHHAPRLFDVVKIHLQTKKGNFYEMEAFDSPSENLTAKMDAIPLDPSKEYPHLVDIQFADDYPRDVAEIELLICNDHADLIKTGNRRVGKPAEPFGLETLFG
ncbi:MAG: hypothetical protein VX367_03665 [SAR324 cluster bacterium]|nr:hypothetical protein [SAR324 cluster bacterium]